MSAADSSAIRGPLAAVPAQRRPDLRPVRSLGRPTPDTTPQYTVDELARLVGMSPRNIRAHQARRLLAPPTRRGRTAYYSSAHVQRLEAIKALQRKGYNLASIEAILGPRSNAPASQAIVQVLESVAVSEPRIVYALTRHKVIQREPDGTFSVLCPRLLHITFEMRSMGIGLIGALTLLVETLDQVRSVSESLVRSCSSRIMSTRSAHRPPTSWEDLDREAAGLAETTVSILAEAFRAAAGDGALQIASTLVSDANGPDLDIALSTEIDTG